MDFGRTTGITRSGMLSLMIADIVCKPVFSGSETRRLSANFPRFQCRSGDRHAGQAQESTAGASYREDTPGGQYDWPIGDCCWYRPIPAKPEKDMWAQAPMLRAETPADFVKNSLNNWVHHVAVALRSQPPDGDEAAPQGEH